jgi:hypothetical protein
MTTPPSEWIGASGGPAGAIFTKVSPRQFHV